MNQIAHTPRQLGQILKGQRKNQQLTQVEAARVVGLYQKTISKLEHAPESATIDSLFKLLSALNLELVVQSRLQKSTDREW